MTKSKTTLIEKDSRKGTALNNYKSKTWLLMMWKTLTIEIRKEIYHSLRSRGWFPKEQKGCNKEKRETGYLLWIDLGGARGVRRCAWCNGYRCRKWTRRYEFKSWTRLIAFHIALIPLGKVWIQLFSLQLWVNSRADCFFSLGEATSLGEGKLWIQTC